MTAPDAGARARFWWWWMTRLLESELPAEDLKWLRLEIRDGLSELFGRPPAPVRMALDAKPELPAERVHRAIKRYLKGLYSAELNRTLEAVLTLMEIADAGAKPNGADLLQPAYNAWMLERCERAFEETGRLIKREDLLRQCSDANGATSREAIAAYNALPDEFKYGRGRPRS
jgi:hypothetical protein